MSSREEYIVVNPPFDSFRGETVDPENPPPVSFCIPTKNSRDTLRACLQSIAAQEYPEIEIVIVDGGSEDETLEIAREYTDRIYFDSGLLGSARQTSVEHARGDIVALFDSDIVIPHKHWLRSAVRYFNYDSAVSTVWPSCLAPVNASRTAKMYRNFSNYVVEDRIRKRRGALGGGNALFLKRCLTEIGGIDRSLHWGEDFDWAQKLKERGFLVVRIDDHLHHDTMRSFSELMKKQFVGARTFTKTGFQLMSLSRGDVLYENVVLGMKGLMKGLCVDRDPSWLLLPPFVMMRALAYGYTYVSRRAAAEDV